MIIGLCGRVAAGKETLTKFLLDKGFVYFETRQLIVEELKKLGLELSRENMQDWADDLRAKEGVGALMKLMLKKAEENKDNNFIFDSLRNVGEAEFLRNNAPNFILIGVDASREIRFKRMIDRNKPSDPKTWEDFLKMDERDNFDTTNPMGQQTGKLIEIADYVIVNDEDLDKAMNQTKDIWEKIKN